MSEEDKMKAANRSYNYDPVEFWKAQNSLGALAAFKREDEKDADDGGKPKV